MPELTAVPQTDHSDAPTTAEEVGPEAAREAWAEAGRAVLLDVAQRYQAVISHKQLAQEVQERTGITTTRLVHYWIGDVLGPIATECASREEPLLVSLCVNAQDSVGAAYANAVQAARGETPEDPEAHAAKERLACYRHFEAEDLPADGGRAALTPRVAATRDRARKVRFAERPIAVCPTCHQAPAATGVCDNCD
ncbi:hypothetical protein [Nocardioides houyundeii]|uniref:hypothetical protein n=1 Tax=Nocardioides houyundeii TaxID=2045452 RepID=UPI000C77B46E|nr:hypothetical protein [Nocardioides houyundeii]